MISMEFGHISGFRIVYSYWSPVPHITWRRERDYPTLKQGLKMPHIKGGNSKCAKYQGASRKTKGQRRRSVTTAGRSSSITRDFGRDC